MGEGAKEVRAGQGDVLSRRWDPLAEVREQSGRCNRSELPCVA